MKTHQNAAQVAVEAAALPGASAASQNTAANAFPSAVSGARRNPSAKQSTSDAAKPRDVFDCIAAGIPRADWESALDSDEAREWSAWLGNAHPEAVTMNETAQDQIKTKVLNLSDEMWHLDAARSALSAVATMTDQRSGPGFLNK